MAAAETPYEFYEDAPPIEAGVLSERHLSWYAGHNIPSDIVPVGFMPPNDMLTSILTQLEGRPYGVCRHVPEAVGMLLYSKR